MTSAGEGGGSQQPSTSLSWVHCGAIRAAPCLFPHPEPQPFQSHRSLEPTVAVDHKILPVYQQSHPPPTPLCRFLRQAEAAGQIAPSSACRGFEVRMHNEMLAASVAAAAGRGSAGTGPVPAGGCRAAERLCESTPVSPQPQRRGRHGGRTVPSRAAGVGSA